MDLNESYKFEEIEKRIEEQGKVGTEKMHTYVVTDTEPLVVFFDDQLHDNFHSLNVHFTFYLFNLETKLEATGYLGSVHMYKMLNNVYIPFLFL